MRILTLESGDWRYSIGQMWIKISSPKKYNGRHPVYRLDSAQISHRTLIMFLNPEMSQQRAYEMTQEHTQYYSFEPSDIRKYIEAKLL